MLINIILAGIGGFIGSALRYSISLIPVKNPVFPYKTLVINILGSFLIALFTALAVRKNLNPRTVLFLKTGFCGGFTTFSTFSLETIQLFETGHPYLAIIYVSASVILGLAAALTAFYLYK